jgi:hypothetical protein
MNPSLNVKKTEKRASLSVQFGRKNILLAGVKTFDEAK